jgi:adenylyltransferase/sulfurtransferase
MRETDTTHNLRQRQTNRGRRFGDETQRLLSNATVAIVGCGALGAMQAELLARMGWARSASPTRHRQPRQPAPPGSCSRARRRGRLPKVAAAATRLAALDSRLALHTVAERVTRHKTSSVRREPTSS